MKLIRTINGKGWSFSILRAWFCLLATLVAAGKASAGSIYAVGNGDWTNTASWIGNVVPGSADTAYVTNNFTLQLTNSESVTALALNLGASTYAQGGGTLVLSNNATMTLTNDSYVGANGTSGANGTLIVASGASLNHIGTSSKPLYIRGAGSDYATGSKMLVDNGSCYFGYHLYLDGNGGQLIVTNGGRVAENTDLILQTGTSNTVWVSGTNAVGSPARLDLKRYLYFKSNNNRVIIGQGGSCAVTNNISFGEAVTSIGSYISVTNGGSLTAKTAVTIGNSANSVGNYISVSGMGANGVRATAGGEVNQTWYVGNNGNNNYLLVSNGGQVTNVMYLNVGGNANCNSNFVSMTSGGVLEQISNGTLTIGNTSSTGNYVRVSDGGVLQFLTANPTAITINNRNSDLGLGNALFINGGILSFRGLTSGTLPNLTNNLAASGTGIGTNNIYWQGVNTFRLDSCNATNTVAGGYTFANTGNAWDYAGLELVNGASAIRGQAVTIGSGGSLLVSNITSGAAMFQGPLTNNSAKMILASVNSLVASNGIVWLNNSAATTTAKTVTFDAYTTNQLAGTVTWHQAATATQVVSGVVNGSGPLQKTGPGVLVLAGTNAYAGGTTVNNGMLNLSGISTGSVSVASGGTILVSGTLTGAVTVASGGVLSGAGKVVGAVTNAGALVATINADGTATGPVVSNLVLQAGAYLSLLGTNYLTAPTNYTVVTYTGTRSGQFDPSLSNVPKGWRISYGQAGKIVVMAGYPGTVLLFQ